MSKKKINSKNHRDAKKAAVLGTDKKRMAPILVLLVGILLAGGGAFAYFHFSGGQAPNKDSYSVAEPKLNTVSYAVNLFNDGKARHFEYKHDSMKIKFFILKSSDGVIRAAFDACDVCWPAGKGYYQEGDSMVCRNCGRRFASVLVNEVKGGCNPAPLKREVVEDQLIINVADILEGKQYFNFS